MKSFNHRSQHLTSSSVGLAEYETPIPEQVYCPLISGTLPRTSCEAKQRDPSMTTCRTDADGNCRAKRKETHTPSAEAREKMSQHALKKTRAKEELTRTIIKKFNQGKKEVITQIADELGCCRELVYLRLREAGIYYPPGGPTRNRVFDWLDDHPDATYLEVEKIFSCAKSTASSYCTQYRKTRRYEEALKKQPKA